MTHRVVLVFLIPLLGWSDDQTWEHLMESAKGLRDQGKYLAAVQAYGAVLEAAIGTSDPRLRQAVTRVELGRIQQLQGNRKQAERIWLKVMEGRDAYPPSLRAVTQFYLGDLYLEERRYTIAGTVFVNCLNDYEAAQEYDMLPTVLVRIADAYIKQSRYQEAVPPLKRASELLTGAGNQGIDLAIVLHTLAGVSSQLGQIPEADSLYERSLRLGESTVGPEDPRLAAPLLSYAQHLRRTKRKEQAKELEARAKLLAAQPKVSDSTVDVNALRGKR